MASFLSLLNSTCKPYNSLQIKGIYPFIFFTYPKVNFKIMTFAYQVTQFNGIDYSTKSPKWNLVAERRTQQQALAVCQTLNQRQPYFHRVEVVKAVELPKFTVLKPAKRESGAIVIPASFKVIKKRNWFLSILGRFF